MIKKTKPMKNLLKFNDYEIYLEMMSEDNSIIIPSEFPGLIAEFGETTSAKQIIALYNEIVEEGTPLVDYSEYGTEGKFYNENDEEIPTYVILDELNYALTGEEFGEDLYESTQGSVDNPNSKAAKSLKSKAKKTGISFTTLKKVYKRGMAAWNAGHRPGTPQNAWAMGRVNSFVTGAGGARKADADLWKGAKEAKARKKKKK